MTTKACRRTRWAHGLAAATALAASPALAAVGVTLTPAQVTRAPQAHAQFTASVSGSSDQTVTWLVNGVPGGAPAIGTVSATGLYTAPADVELATRVQVQAVPAANPLTRATATVRLTAATASPGSTFHVAVTGSDGADGSAATPWKTIQHAVSSVPAGSTVLVHGGVYNEVVTINRGGSASAGFTTISTAPGEAVILDGSGLPVGNGGQQGLFTLHNANWIRLIGFEVRNFTSNSASKVPVGIYVWGSGNHIEILDNHIHDITTTVKTSAGDALGMAIYGSATTPISQLVIDGNELDDLVTGYSESLTINGNVQQWQVTNNQVHDNDNIGIDAIGFEQTAPTPTLDQARDGWIADNRVWNITSTNNPAYGNQPGADGIYVDGGTRIVIERNSVDHADIGIELASEHKSRTTSYVTARDNLVTFSTIAGISIGGYANGVGGTENCTIANNTLFENDTSHSGSGEFQVQYHADANTFRNNIVFANSQALVVNSFVAANADPANLDYNLYDAQNGVAKVRWRWANKTYASLPAFRAASGGEVHGQLTDPHFVSTAATTFDLSLADGSPAIDHGGNFGLASSGPADFDGDARVHGPRIDRGAYEH